MNDILSQTLIRPARPEDSEAIAILMQEGVSDQVRRITIIGSPYLARFIADEMAVPGGEEYVVATMQERIVGICSWKHTDESLHLNHLYLNQKVRGHGVGTALMLDSLARIRRASEHMVSVDVFSDTPRAQAWYRTLTMRPETHVRWIRLPLPLVRSDDWAGCTISGLDEATVKHLRYGFSQFVLSTSTSTYRVGRLGDHAFRAGTVSIIQDPTALQGLAHLDSKRHLICTASSEDWAKLSLDTNTCVAESERLVSSYASVAELLKSSLSRKRHIVKDHAR